MFLSMSIYILSKNIVKITGHKVEQIKVEQIVLPYSRPFNLTWAKKRKAEVTLYFKLKHPTFFGFALLAENKEKFKLDYLTNMNNLAKFGQLLIIKQVNKTKVGP